jgi:digeranylgeranylglycerophospholipid reductase
LKVVVVGAGPAGSAVAETVLRLQPKHDVTIVEQRGDLQENPRCAGGVHAMAFDELGIPVPPEVFAAKISRLQIHSPDNNYWEIDAKSLGLKCLGYIFNRGLLDRCLCERAQKLGAKLMLDTKALQIDGKTNILVTDTSRILFDVLVNARGPVFNKDKSDEFRVGIQEIVHGDHPQDLISMYFGQELAPHGYGWVVPDGEGKVKVGVGIGCSLKSSPKAYLKLFEHKLGVTPGDVVPASKLVPTGKPPKTGVKKGPCGTTILSVGDSLPACDPLHGGGIINAIVSGRAAGRAIAGGFPQMYDKFWRSELCKENLQRYRMKTMLEKFSDENFNTAIDMLKGFRPESASVGHELGRVFMFLARKAPRLVGKKLLSRILFGQL